ACDQQELKKRNVGKAGNHRHGLAARENRATARSARDLSAEESSGKSAASQAASASVITCPSSGPSPIPRARKSAAFTGNLGALQRAGKAASSRQRAAATSFPDRAQASITRSR